jgi:hypothetical protein
LNRRDCCGQRLKGVKVSVGGTECGTINENTRNGQWYTVKCSRPLRGDKIVLETTRADYLSISGIEAYTATCRGACGGTSGFRPTVMRSMTKTMTGMPMMRMGGGPMKMGGSINRKAPPVFDMGGN